MSDPTTTYQDIERIWLTADGGIKAALRAMAEYFDGQRRPVEVTDAAVEALAQELRGVWSDTEARSSWIHLPAKTKEEWLKVARHVLASRQPKPEDVGLLAERLQNSVGPNARLTWPDFARAVLALYDAPPETETKCIAELQKLHARRPQRDFTPQDWRSWEQEKFRLLEAVWRHAITGRPLIIPHYDALETANARIADLEDERGAPPTFESLRQLFWDRGIHGERGADLAREVVRMCEAHQEHDPDTAETIGERADLMTELGVANDRIRVLEAELVAAKATIASLKIQVATWKGDEKALSDAYLRLRAKIPSAFDTQEARSVTDVWTHTEISLDQLVAQVQSPAIRLGKGLTEAQIVGIAKETRDSHFRRIGRTAVEGFDPFINSEWMHYVRDTIAALRASAAPKTEAVDWVAIAQDHLDGVGASADGDAIIAGLVATLQAKVV